MNLHDILQSPVIARLGWTLLHSIWEGVAVAFVLVLVLLSLRRRSAQSRYVASCIAMLVLAIAPSVTFVTLKPAPLPSPTVSSPSIGAAAAALGITSNSGLPAAPSEPSSREQPRTSPQGSIGNLAAAAPVGAAQPAKPANPKIHLPHDLLPWLVLAWAAGVSLLSLWNLGGWLALHRLKTLHRRLVHEDVIMRAERLCRRLNLNRRVQLLESTLVRCPLVIGALKPVILLPVSIVCELPASQLESILAHELAHIRRQDYLVNLFQSVIETLLFYHPAVWWISRRIRSERENCCDDIALSVTSDRVEYARALAALASVRSPALAPAATGGILLSRVRRVLGMPDGDAARSSKWLAGAIALGAVLIAFIGFPAMSGRSKATAQSAPATRPAAAKAPAAKVAKMCNLDFQAVDQITNAPLGNTSLRVRGAQTEYDRVRTDASGRAKVAYGADERELVITATRDGYVPEQLWLLRMGRPGTTAPPSYLLKMEPGTQIGGIVADERGKPIVGATVNLIVARHGENGEVPRRAWIWDERHKTDAQGRWSSRDVPADIGTMMIRLEHPDFLSDEMYGMTPAPPLSELRAGTGVMVLKKGVPVEGRVLTNDGQPIGGARVLQGEEQGGYHYPETKTDPEGRFLFAHCRPGNSMTLTVTASGRAPDLKKFMVSGAVSDVEFRLGPGHLVRGRVLDSDGKPVAGALLVASGWRSASSLTWETHSGLDGRFIWREAPADAVKLDILHIDFTDLRGQTVMAGAPEQSFTLRRLMMISGSVVEAQSGTPINIFRLVRGRSYSPDQRISWSYRGTEAKSYGGTFEFSEGSWPLGGDQRMLRVEAEGYLPAELPIPQASDRPVVLEFKLTPAADLNGTIVDPQGRPASGVLVVLGTASQGIAITNGALDESSESPGTRTDSQGRFRFPAQREQFLLVAACDAGYAEVPGDRLPPAGRIELKPWGTIRGRLMIGDKPGPLQRIVGEMDRVVDSTGPQVYKSFDTRSAADGRFAIERVPPGSFRLAHLIIVGDGRPAAGSSVHLMMEAGGTANVLIGGTGRPVTGRVAMPLTLAASPNSTALWGNLTENPVAGGPAGSGLAARAPESFVVPISPDGSFRVEDVPAGNYRLDVGLYNPPPPNTCGFGELLASAIREVVVPEMPGGRSDQPLVVDSIQLQPSQVPKIGDRAPELSVAGLDGKTISLSNYRGKYVLIDFWATWCTPCVQELPVLQRIHDTFGKDPRFVMLGLSLDQTPEALRNFVARKGIDWQQGYLGAWGTTRTPDQWGANSIPAAFLIAPDGRILAAQLRGDAVAAAVAQALHVAVPARPTQPARGPGAAGAGTR